ncbi:MAG: DUF6164 family protein [Thiotrichales bacterium]
MAVLLFSLKQVPDDEADEVRALLEANRIEFYETAAGRWGISSAAIWLRDEVQTERAKALLADYQAERYQRARAAFEAGERAGANPTVVGELLAHPVRFAVYLLAIILILYLSVAPFFL